MAAFERPDIYVTESLRPGIRSSALPATPSGAFLGVSQRGPANKAVLVESWTAYRTSFGGFEPERVDSGGLSPLHYAVHQFFTNGGSRCWVTRVTDGTGVASTIDLQDRATTPVDTLTVSAKSQGLWGNTVKVGIFDRGDPESGRFDIMVYDGTAVDANIVERFTDLSMDPAVTRYVEGVINSETRGSKFITVENMGSATTAPDNAPDVGTFDLASGTDGSAPDATDYTSAIDSLDAIQEGLIVNIPANVDNSVNSGLLAFCEGRTDCFAIIDTADADVSAALTQATALSPPTSYGAVYWPPLVINDPAMARAGSTKVVPPGGAVVGTFMRTDATSGPARTPAGAIANLRGVVGLSQEATLDELGTLNVSGVNAIRQYPDLGLAIMGGRTLKMSGPDRYISIRRSLIYIKTSMISLLRFAQFESNDHILWMTVTNEVSQWLNGYWRDRGLRGATAGEAYFVKCDAENNPVAAIEEGELHVEIGVCLQYPAEFIILRIGQFESGAITVEEAA